MTPSFRSGILIIIYLFFSAGLFMYAESSHVEYTSMEGESLLSVAEKVYSRMENSGNSAYEDRLRAVLIYKTNREVFNDDLTLHYFSSLNDIPLDPGTKLKIPVLDDSYPSVSELKESINSELALLAENIKSKNEFPGIQRLSNQISDKVISAVFKPPVDDKPPSLIGVDFSETSYSLSDGSVIPPENGKGYVNFVRQIVEHSNSTRTVFIFPKTNMQSNSNFIKFLTMEKLTRANKDKAFSLFITDNVNVQFDTLRTRYSNMESSSLFPDYRKILNNRINIVEDQYNIPLRIYPSWLMALSPVIADINNIEDDKAYNQQRNLYIRDLVTGRRDAASEIKSKTDLLQANYNRYVNMKINLFISNIETSIFDAVKKDRIKDSGIINRINQLQIEFAGIYRRGDIAEIISEYETEITDIFSEIDNLSSSETENIFHNFKKNIMAENEEFEKQKTDILAFIEEKNSSNETSFFKKLDDLYEKSVAAQFSSMPESFIGFCELDTKSILSQIKLCDENKNYNLVVYNLPLVNHISTEISSEQNIDDAVLPGSFFENLVIPEKSEDLYLKDRSAKSMINWSFTLFKQSEDFKDYLNLDPGQIYVSEMDVFDIGGLYKLVSKVAPLGSVVRYFFIPGRNIEQRKLFLTTISGSEKLSRQVQLILRKYISVVETAGSL